MTSKLMRLPLVLAAAVLALSGCDPQEMADKALRRTAESVVQPVLAREMPGDVADVATRCILDAAEPGEINILARDVGVEAGSQTVENIRNIATRPAVAACFAAGGVPSLRT
jgi:hypothetical protein